MKLNKSCAMLMAVYFTFFCTGAQASLQDSLNGMFAMSNSTSAGAVATQNRGGFVGGGIALRSGIQSLNVAAFDPPRFNAGCGGLDVFGGSFSFINSAQLVALFRSIAANSTGMAFQMAISAINPTVGAMMEKFQKMVQEMNKAMGDSCQVAQKLFATAKNAIGTEEAVDSDASMVAQATGSVSTFFDGITNRLTEFNQSAINIAKTPAQLSKSKQGNPVWKAITATMANGSMVNGSTLIDSNPQFSNEIMMSILGTIWIGPSPTASASSDGVTETDSSTNTTKQYPPLLVLHDLIAGNTDGRVLKKYTCTDSTSCWISSAAGGDTFTYSGIKGYVNTQVWGTADASSGIQSGSILDVIQSGGSLSSAQITFLQQFKSPLIAALKKAGSNSFMLAVVADKFADLMVVELSLQFGELVDRQARTIFSGTTFQKPDGFDQNQKILKEDINLLRVQAAKNMDELVKSMQFIHTMVQSVPSAATGFKK